MLEKGKIITFDGIDEAEEKFIIINEFDIFTERENFSNDLTWEYDDDFFFIEYLIDKNFIDVFNLNIDYTYIFNTNIIEEYTND